ncbi:MAG: co-chaperone GroES [Planctomycetes bacterium]|nr:co-chaperone GroES [Planctomycetota bacterium]MBI3834199.1 co-chaperone GroES [Planctomycetota bacterium]
MATATAIAPKAKSKTSVKFQPMEDRVLIQSNEADERTSGGIILPDTAKEKPQRGTIVAVGPGKILKNGKRAPMTVKVGDEVLYGKYSGTEVDFGADRLVVTRESDLLAIVNQ